MIIIAFSETIKVQLNSNGFDIYRYFYNYHSFLNTITKTLDNYKDIAVSSVSRGLCQLYAHHLAVEEGQQGGREVVVWRFTD